MKWATLTLMLCGVFSWAGDHAPVSPKLLQAKTVFLQVDTDASDKQADVMFAEVKQWKRWTVVDDRAKADLILAMDMHDAGTASMSTGSATAYNGYATGTGMAIPIPIKSYHLHVVDRETGNVLWNASVGQSTKAHEAKALLGKLRKRIAEVE